MHFSIRPSREMEDLANAARVRAAADPTILHFPGGRAGYLFAFCHDPAVAELVQQTYEREHRIIAGVCFLSFASDVIQVDLEGLEPSITQASRFLSWLLGASAPCEVTDDDSGDVMTGEDAAARLF